VKSRPPPRTYAPQHLSRSLEALSSNDVGLQLFENSTPTAFGLAVLILLFGPVSGAHRRVKFRYPLDE